MLSGGARSEAQVLREAGEWTGTGYMTVDAEYRPFCDELMVVVEAAAGGSAPIGFAFGPIKGAVFIAISIALACITKFFNLKARANAKYKLRGGKSTTATSPTRDPAYYGVTGNARALGGIGNLPSRRGVCGSTGPPDS
jgi:hypothetical protein